MRKSLVGISLGFLLGFISAFLVAEYLRDHRVVTRPEHHIVVSDYGTGHFVVGDEVVTLERLSYWDKSRLTATNYVCGVERIAPSGSVGFETSSYREQAVWLVYGMNGHPFAR